MKKTKTDKTLNITKYILHKSLKEVDKYQKAQDKLIREVLIGGTNKLEQF